MLFYGFSRTICCLLILLVTYIAADVPPKFHTKISAEERRHYFGTDLIEQVPRYEYITPQLVDRRRKRSTTEDDSLEYIVDAFGEATHLILEKNKDLISPGCVVQHLGANGTNNVYPCASHEVNCFYTGRSSNHSDSWVAASVCGGMHAMIGLPEKTLVIQPISDQHLSRARRDTLLPKPYIVYQYEDKKRGCTSADTDADTGSETRSSRKRRSTSGKRYIETTVVVDPTAYRFHRGGTEKMVKTIMNIVAQRYLDPSLGTQLYLTLNKISILEQQPTGLNIDEDSGVTLNSFCDWQSQWNPPRDSDPHHSDYVVLITKKDLEHRGEKTNTGLARKGMCGQKTKCSVNEDNGLGTGLIIAHETGHVLGMSHDSVGNDCPDGINLMSSMAPSGPQALKWSSCSARYLSQYLSNEDSSCLDDEPPAAAEKLYNNRIKPGTIYSANQQCKLMFGNEAEVCEGSHANNQDVCGGIVCRAKPGPGVTGCIIFSTPRMDGTDCGNRKWCIGGSCVSMGAGAPDPVNGGWSEWDTSFSECSRSCGGGVKVKHRYCNNPEPMYGGQNCVGDSIIAEICNIGDCTKTQQDFLAEQCAATDGVQLRGHTYHWKPNTDNLGDDSCRVSCLASETEISAKRGISVDGSECFIDSRAPFFKCVSGKCKEFGCDGHAAASDQFLQYDKCGVCNGNGDTCRSVTGSFHGGQAKVFTTFVTIPVGSTGILVTQKNKYCSLSAKVHGHQLFSSSSSKQSGTHKLENVLIKYQSTPERLEITGPISAPVELQVYRTYGAVYVGVDPDVYYEYHIPTTPRTGSYMWKTKAGACSKTCGTGEQIPTLTCISSVTGSVDDYNCDIYDKPREAAQPCNTHACPPRWRTSPWGHCSKSCGGGQRHRTVECVEENNNVEKVLSDSRCHTHRKPSVTGSCNQDDCPGTWQHGAWTTCSESCARGLKTRSVKCYKNGQAIADDKCIAGDRPKAQEYCVIKPCRTDITGAACKDEKDNCFGSYGDDVCTGAYKSWARKNCMKSCGVCSVTSSVSVSNCRDTVSTCNQYQDGFCTDAAYANWAKKHCSKFCGFCQEVTTTTTTTQKPPVSSDCMDTDDCPAYGKGACTDYAAWAKTHCKKFCNMCETKTQSTDNQVCENTANCEGYGQDVCTQFKDFANTHCRKFCGLCQGCKDQDENCAAYGSSVCEEYKGWSSTHCQGYCGLCKKRRRRSVTFNEDDLIVPPLMNEIAPPKVLKEDRLTDQLLRIAVRDKNRFDEDDNVSDLLEEDEVPQLTEDRKIPSKPLCNTVLTAKSETFNLIGKLVPGETCEQTIALPAGDKISIKIIDNIIDCDAGDIIKLIDVINGETIDICDVTQTDLTSSGNIVVVKVTAGSEGHGIAYTYQAIPQDEHISACNQYFVSSVGEISPVRYPVGFQSTENEVCDIYVTATPGDSVQLVFNTFNMTQGGEDHCVTVTDLDGGEEDVFCGELSPFIWESSGSLIKLGYKQFFSREGFDITYTVQK